MNKVLIKIIMPLQLLILYSCNSTNENAHQNKLDVKKTYYEDGNVRAEATYNEDSLKDGYGKLFYPDGQLEIEIEYQNGKKEGYEIGYYQNGDIKYIGFNKNDYPVGQHLNFYQDSVLKSYILYNPVGRVVYKRKYNLGGKVVGEEGSKNTQIISVTTNDNHFTIGDTLEVRIYAPTPPDSEAELIVRILGKEGRLLEKQKVKIEQGLANYSKVLKDTGSYFFATQFTFNDLSIDSLEKYENSFPYWVEVP